MKIFKLLTAVLVILTWFACSDEMPYKIEGYWQLKQVSYPNGRVDLVDTVFYGFQKQTVFSFTTLENADSATISYGYLDFQGENKIRIQMDMNHSEPDFLTLSGWRSTDEIFSIDIRRNKMEMIDSQERVFSLNRF